MSGGSYNYLYSQDLSNISTDDLQAMAGKLLKEGAEQAAKDTIAVIELRDRLCDEFNNAINNLRDLWRVAEWQHDFDLGYEDLVEAIDEYNKLKENRTK